MRMTSTDDESKMDSLSTAFAKIAEANFGFCDVICPSPAGGQNSKQNGKSSDDIEDTVKFSEKDLTSVTSNDASMWSGEIMVTMGDEPQDGRGGGRGGGGGREGRGDDPATEERSDAAEGRSALSALAEEPSDKDGAVSASTGRKDATSVLSGKSGKSGKTSLLSSKSGRTPHKVTPAMAATPRATGRGANRASSLHETAASLKAAAEAEAMRRYASLKLEEKLSGSKLRAQTWASYLRGTPGRAEVLGKATYCEYRAMIPVGGPAPPPGSVGKKPGERSVEGTQGTLTGMVVGDGSVSTWGVGSVDNAAASQSSYGSGVYTNLTTGTGFSDRRGALRALVRDVSMTLSREVTVRNLSFDPRGCLWQADVYSETATVVPEEGDEKKDDGKAIDGEKRVRPYKLYIKVCGIDSSAASSSAQGTPGAVSPRSGAPSPRGRSRSSQRSRSPSMGGMRPLSRSRSKSRDRRSGGVVMKQGSSVGPSGSATRGARLSDLASGGVGGASVSPEAAIAAMPPAKFQEFVAAMQLIGKGPDAESLYVRVSSAIRAALIRLELPARLPMGRRFDEGIVAGKTWNERQPRGFHAEYELGDEITSGAFATVYRGAHRPSGRKCAIKIISRSKLSIVEEATVLSEVILHASVTGHPNIVDLYDFFEEQHNFYLVMELMAGDLFDHIKRPFVPKKKGKQKKDEETEEDDKQQRGYSEQDARDMIKSLLIGLQRCHERNLAHCDLKPKNVMLVAEGDETQVKVGDFGLSSRSTGPESLTRLCGSPLYVAPEVIQRKPYDTSADMWSVGAMTYLVLGGSTPFMGSTLAEIFPKITAGKFTYPPEYWDPVSKEAKDLINGLLTLDPKKRLTAEEALNSPWMQMTSKELAKRDLKRAKDSLKTFNRKIDSAKMKRER